MHAAASIVCILLIVCLVILALVLACAVRAPFTAGGAARKRPAPPKSPHIVVDTLNLTYWLGSTSKSPMQISTAAIVNTIAQTADIVKKMFPGRIMYVLKDRESVLNDPDTRKAYADAAREHSVYIYAVERYEEPPRATRRAGTHSERGRDDFYAAVLAKRYRCSVLSEDKFRDFDQFRTDVTPFHVYEYNYWRDLPDRDYVDPSAPAFKKLRKPHTICYASAELTPLHDLVHRGTKAAQ